MPDDIHPKPEAFSRAWWLLQLQLVLPTNWREMVRYLILILFLQLVGCITGEKQPTPVFEPMDIVTDSPLTEDEIAEAKRRGINYHPGGWKEPTPEKKRQVLSELHTATFAETEAGHELIADSDAPLYRIAFKGRGGVIPTRDQGSVGSCVGFGFTAAGEYTMAGMVGQGVLRQDLPDFAQEATYAGSRVEANGGRSPYWGDGSTGSDAAKWIDKVGGYLPRGTYGSLDLSSYSTSRCRQWGSKGVPDDLEAICKSHSARCTLVQSSEEARKALSQGYAIAVCSTQGFSSTRDEEGFSKARGMWPHCMAIVGYRSDRRGFLILNSWGPNWNSGPKGTKFPDIPDGSFWAEWDVVERMLRQGDSYAVANADGFKKRKIDPMDWVVKSTITPKQLNRNFDHVFALAP